MGMQHLKTVAWLHFVVGVLTLALGCWSLGLTWWVSAPTSEPNEPQHFHEGMLLLSLMVSGAILLPIGIFQTIAGWKLFLEKAWAKKTILILVWFEVFAMMPFIGRGGAIYMLFPFVFGLAGYSTWVLQLQTKECVANRS